MYVEESGPLCGHLLLGNLLKFFFQHHHFNQHQASFNPDHRLEESESVREVIIVSEPFSLDSKSKYSSKSALGRDE
jgi:hypothetical protein